VCFRAASERRVSALFHGAKRSFSEKGLSDAFLVATGEGTKNFGDLIEWALCEMGLKL
jgi:hypothetical protein